MPNWSEVSSHLKGVRQCQPSCPHSRQESGTSKQHKPHFSWTAFPSLNCASDWENKIKEVVLLFSIYLSLEKEPFEQAKITSTSQSIGGTLICVCVSVCVYVCETFIRIPTMKKHHKEVCLTCLQETIGDMQPNPGHKILIRHFLSASKRQESLWKWRSRWLVCEAVRKQELSQQLAPFCRKE